MCLGLSRSGCRDPLESLISSPTHLPMIRFRELSACIDAMVKIALNFLLLS